MKIPFLKYFTELLLTPTLKCFKFYSGQGVWLNTKLKIPNSDFILIVFFTFFWALILIVTFAPQKNQKTTFWLYLL